MTRKLYFPAEKDGFTLRPMTEYHARQASAMSGASIQSVHHYCQEAAAHPKRQPKYRTHASSLTITIIEG